MIRLITYIVAFSLAFHFGCAHSPTVDRGKSFTRLELAKDYLVRKQYDAARVEAEKALKFDSTSEQAHNVLGLVHFLYGLRNFGIREMDDCLTGVDAEALQSEFADHMTKADHHFSTAIKLEPEYGEACANRGIVAMQILDFAKAVEFLHRALSYPQRLQNIAITRGHLGWAYFRKGEIIKAAKELRQSVQFQKGLCVSMYRLGRVYFARKEWQKAKDQFRSVVNACPMQEAHLYLSKTLHTLGKVEESHQAAKRCADLLPSSCIAARCRGELGPGARNETENRLRLLGRVQR